MKISSKTSLDIKLFLNIFIALNIVFSFYTINFFIGNHDWDWVKGTNQILSLDTGMFEARFSKFILNVVLFSGQIFPILNNLVSFFLASVGMVLVVNYFNIKDTITKNIVALLPLMAPYILGWLYFPINILGNFMALALVSGALILSEKNKLINQITAIVFLVLSLGVYPSTIETMFILYSFKNILSEKKDIKTSLCPLQSIIMSILLFKIIVFFMTEFDMIYKDHYNMKINTITDIIKNIPSHTKLFFSQLYMTLPFFPRNLKIVGFIAVFLAFLLSIKDKRNIIFWMLAFLSTILSAILAKNPLDVAFMPRINFYGLNFLYCGAFAYLLMQKKAVRNLGLVLSIFYMFISVEQNFYAQKVWELGRIAEINQTARILNRLEPKAKHLPLTPVFTDTISLRSKYYHEKYDIKSPYILEKSFTIRHIPSGIYNFYAVSDVFNKTTQISDLTPELEYFLSTSTAIWPDENSIYIDDKYFVIMMTQLGTQAIKSQLPK